MTFRLTLRGDVDPADSFSLAINASSGTIYSVGMMCGPASPTNPADVPVCSARSYDAGLGGEVGDELTYTFSREPSYDGSGDTAEPLHVGTVTVTGSPQTVTLVYEYAGATLPDTAVPVSCCQGGSQR